MQDAQGKLDRGRLAGRRAAVGLQAVPEPAVGIAVGRDRVAHRLGSAVAQQPAEPAPVQDPAAGGDELFCGVYVRNVHAADSTTGRACPS